MRLKISSADEHSQALDRVQRLLELKPRPGSAEDDELHHLVRLIEGYELVAPLPARQSIRPISAIRKELRQRRQDRWSDLWATPERRPPWADRGVSPEIVEAVASGWLPPRGRVLDVGCGLGEITGWFWERGYRATGIDYEEAVRKARERHPRIDPHYFLAMDICDAVPFNNQFDIIVDRGCLHSIPAILTDDYVRNISLMASPEARMLLFSKAFRGSRPFADPLETRDHVDRIRRMFQGVFIIDRHAATYLNRGGVRDQCNPLPGLVFWLKRP